MSCLLLTSPTKTCYDKSGNAAKYQWKPTAWKHLYTRLEKAENVNHTKRFFISHKRAQRCVYCIKSYWKVDLRKWCIRYFEETGMHTVLLNNAFDLQAHN